MKSLYESILSSTKSGLKSFVWDKTKPVIDDVITARTEFPMLWFLEGNNLRLDKDTVNKIVNKLKKVLPKNAVFGRNYGIRQIDKQNVEEYNSANSPNHLKYSYYKIEIEYAIRPLGKSRSVSRTGMSEFLIYLTEDCIYALDIPETKSILNELDTHFAKYVTQDEVKLTDSYTIWSKLGGKYRIYSFKDLIKEFVATKQ